MCSGTRDGEHLFWFWRQNNLRSHFFTRKFFGVNFLNSLVKSSQVKCILPNSKSAQEGISENIMRSSKSTVPTAIDGLQLRHSFFPPKSLDVKMPLQSIGRKRKSTFNSFSERI